LTSASPLCDLRIHGDRLCQSLLELAKIGATPKGGVCRLALTDLDKQGRMWVLEKAHRLGLEITTDQIGNTFMRRSGKNTHLPPVMTGSHIDTQPTGGKYDGNYGVLAGLEVIETLIDHGIETEAPIEVVFWTNEEGSRFTPVMMGSGVFSGAVSLDHAYAAQDIKGKNVKEELLRIGFLGNQKPGDHPCGAYFEAHIEQGPVLENQNIVIGVVPAVMGLRWFDCTVHGFEAHAGPTPMDIRSDALQNAMKIMQYVIEIAQQYSPHGRGTVGMVQVFPNSRNVIPGQVQFSIDIRHPDSVILDKMTALLKDYIAQVSSEKSIAIDLKEVSYFPPCNFDANCVDIIRQAATDLDYSQMDVISGAGHDAIYMNRLAPTGMIFIPCKDGVSHNEIEDAKAEHLEAGANVLLHSILAFAKPVTN
jgi:beta-ureidopropionase / N-carbamoyl-L-amino-acid hydrolase